MNELNLTLVTRLQPGHAYPGSSASLAADRSPFIAAAGAAELRRPAFPGGSLGTRMDDVSTARAQVETQSFQTTELDLPESTVGILLLVGGLAAVAALTVRISLRDSRFLKRVSRTLLLIPRLLVLTLLLVILLNPQRRTQLNRVEKSRVGLILDTSLSMAWPAGDAAPPGGPPKSETRADAAMKSLIESGVLAELSRTHAVSVYTFDSALAGPWAIVADNTVRFVDVDPSANGDRSQATQDLSGQASVSLDKPENAVSIAITDPAAMDKWETIFQPRGAETRIGESLYQLIGQLSGRTLSGVVVVSDGRSNAGVDIQPAHTRPSVPAHG